MSPDTDYFNADLSYFMGLLVARGSLSEISGANQITIEFPYVSLQVQGTTTVVDQETAIRLGLNDIRERLLELLDTDIKIVRHDNGIDLVIRFLRNNMVWRTISSITEGITSYPGIKVPSILFSKDVSKEVKREFVRGYADVAGNIRHANRYVDGRHRVRLDILNSKNSWELPIQLCTLLQEHLEVPVQALTWGHPNLGRGFREHQLNVFAKPFENIGFTFEHKQKILQEFIEADRQLLPNSKYTYCYGSRSGKRKKPKHADENSDKLDDRLMGKHFNHYWQICNKLGCKRKKPLKGQLKLKPLG